MANQHENLDMKLGKDNLPETSILFRKCSQALPPLPSLKPFIPALEKFDLDRIKFLHTGS